MAIKMRARDQLVIHSARSWRLKTAFFERGMLQIYKPAKGSSTEKIRPWRAPHVVRSELFWGKKPIAKFCQMVLVTRITTVPVGEFNASAMRRSSKGIVMAGLVSATTPVVAINHWNEIAHHAKMRRYVLAAGNGIGVSCRGLLRIRG